MKRTCSIWLVSNALSGTILAARVVKTTCTSFGNLEVRATINDPKAFTKP